MRCLARGRGVRRVLLLAFLCLCTGQMCADVQGPPVETTPQVPVATACGLLASDCVPLQGSFPQALAVGDFDSDGDLDLIVINGGTDNVTVLLNDGGARFTADRNYAVGNSPAAIAAGDWDGDGDLDLAVVTYLSAVVLMNRGDATFEPAVDLGLGVSLLNLPMEIDAADLDGDGDADLATANTFPDSVTVLTNDGTGAFTASLAFGGEVPDQAVLPKVAAGDVNGDGLADLLVGRFSGNVSVLLNTGSATFAPPAEVAVSQGHFLNRLLVTDLDGDGDNDLAVADDGEPPYTEDGGSLALLFNNGDGTFAGPTRVQVGLIPQGLAAADLDGDGDLDLAVANEVSDDVSLVFNQGNGTFAERERIAVGDGPVFVVAADLDGDADADLATANMNSDSVAILLNSGTGSFTVED